MKTDKERTLKRSGWPRGKDLDLFSGSNLGQDTDYSEGFRGYPGVTKTFSRIKVNIQM
jgi:hypothetical protein